MDSKLLLHDQQKHITLSNLNPKNNHVTNLNHPIFKLINNEPKSARPHDSIVPISTELASSWYSEQSESGSCSGVSGDDDDEEVSVEYDDELLMHDGKTKRKIEELAAMVGVDTTEPAVVLSEVVRVVKHLNSINHIHY